MQGQGREGWKQWEAEEGRSIAVASVVSLGFAHISHLRPTATRPLGQLSHVWASLAGLCHPGAHHCHLPACALGSSEVLSTPA